MVIYGVSYMSKVQSELVSIKGRNLLEIFLLKEGHKFPKLETVMSHDMFQFQTVVDN